MIAHRLITARGKVSICRRCRSLSTFLKHDRVERRPSQRLPATPARTRFAPSPTGYLHLGSLRTALFNYLTAKATGGQFILRIEDTDKRRLVDDAESRLYEDLKWAGLQWDEGPDIGGIYGPYKQSERTSLYREHAGKLLQSGHAYRCFCSTERLNSLVKERMELGFPGDYDRNCANISTGESDARACEGESHVVRLKVPDLPVPYTDLVYGIVGQRRSQVKHQSHGAQPSYEDPVLIKSDGCPTYHLANVVDDHCMEITHVIRAAEWMSSTSKHVIIYNALNWQPPTFAHVGLLQDDSRQKFSKRNLAPDIQSFRNDGIFAEALVNYVALFGWSHRLGDDYLSLQDLVQNFDLKFTKGNTIAAPNKLNHLQKRYAQKYVEEEGQEYTSMVQKVFAVAEQHLQSNPENKICPISEVKNRISALLHVDAKNYTTPQAFFERNSHFLCLQPRGEYHRSPRDRPLTDNMGTIVHYFQDIPQEQWDEASLKQAYERMADDLSTKWELNYDQNVDPAKASRTSLQQFLRWALTGGRPGPALILTMSLLGRDVSLSRIEDAAASLRGNST